MHVIAHIGKSIQIKGEVTSQEPLTIAGQVIGTIDVSGHPLTVTETATIEADVMARTIIVSGTVSGTLQAETSIIVEKTATLSGDVSAPSLTLPPSGPPPLARAHHPGTRTRSIHHNLRTTM